jgi:DNA-binding transcriptional MocR family regulator
MTIRDDIKTALAKKPMSMKQLAELTGHSLASVTNAKGYLQADGIVQQVPKQKPGSPHILFELAPIRTATHHGNVLTAPVWVPPKVLHRPTINAPGCVVREHLTGRKLA